jgi:hypothetical protein
MSGLRRELVVVAIWAVLIAISLVVYANVRDTDMPQTLLQAGVPMVGAAVLSEIIFYFSDRGPRKRNQSEDMNNGQ